MMMSSDHETALHYGSFIVLQLWSLTLPKVCGLCCSCEPKLNWSTEKTIRLCHMSSSHLACMCSHPFVINENRINITFNDENPANIHQQITNNIGFLSCYWSDILYSPVNAFLKICYLVTWSHTCHTSKWYYNNDISRDQTAVDYYVYITEGKQNLHS